MATEAFQGFHLNWIIVLNLLLNISQSHGVTAAQFITLNAATLVVLCSLYTAFLFFLYRKRIRTGLYDSTAPDA